MTLRSSLRTWGLGSVILLCCNLSAQTISGKVKDALLKTPIAGAKIKVLELKKEALSDSAGFYTLDSLAKGNYSVSIEKENYLRQTKIVKLAAAQGQAGSTSINLDIVLFSVSSNADQSSGQLAIKYFFPGHANVEINVCDSLGKVVRTVFDRSRENGMRTFRWNGVDNKGKNVPSGRYSCKIESGNLLTTRTLLWNGNE